MIIEICLILRQIIENLFFVLFDFLFKQIHHFLMVLRIFNRNYANNW